MSMWDDGSDSEDDWSPGSDCRSNQFTSLPEMRRMRQRKAGISSCAPQSTLEDDRMSASAALSTSDAICIPELFLRKSHRGRVLYGMLCIEPVLDLSADDLVTILVDTKLACSIRVITSKLLWRGASASLATTFSVGKQIAIKGPSIEVCPDGIEAVRVINRSQVIFLESVNAGCDSAAESTAGTVLEELDKMSIAGTVLEELEKVRSEGNRFFAEQNWVAAVDWYSKCIRHALDKLGDDGSFKTTREEDLNRVLMLSYSNRAEARLRLHHYEDALSDADEALKFDPKHMKTLVRKGRAAHGLGLFERSCTSFEAALRESPGEQSIVKHLAASTTALKQSRHGDYDLVDFYLNGGVGKAPSCADFIGPVEIRRVSYGHGRRGLFATRNVKAGELFLVSNPLAVVRQNGEPGHHILSNPSLYKFKYQMTLAAELAERARTSKRHMAQLYSLCTHGIGEQQIPSMELFKAGSEWVPQDLQTSEEVDTDLIDDIVRMNGRGSFEYDQFPNAFFVPEDICFGVWLLPSFANHSCSPTVRYATVGDAMFFRASVDVVEGEELTISYLVEPTLFEAVASRQRGTATWFFTCNCKRCLLEEALQQKISKIFKISKAMPKDVNPFASKRYQDKMMGRELKVLSRMVVEVESLIQNNEPKLGPKEQGWIRALFVAAYMSQLSLVLDDGDRAVRMWMLILDSTCSVCIGSLGMTQVSNLLEYVKQRYSKGSRTYQQTLERARVMFKVYFGDQKNIGLHMEELMLTVMDLI